MPKRCAGSVNNSFDERITSTTALTILSPILYGRNKSIKTPLAKFCNVPDKGRPAATQKEAITTANNVSSYRPSLLSNVFYDIKKPF